MTLTKNNITSNGKRADNTFSERKAHAYETVSLKAEGRKHEIHDFEFQNTRTCTFAVFCKRHNKLHEKVSYFNYTDRRVSWGVSCCAYPEKSCLITHKRNQAAKWKRSLGTIICPISKTTQSVVAHHLFGKAIFPQLETVSENGIFLHFELHDQYHASYGKKERVTVDTFLEFLHQLIFELSILTEPINLTKELSTKLKDVNKYISLGKQAKENNLSTQDKWNKDQKKKEISKTFLLHLIQDSKNSQFLEHPSINKKISNSIDLIDTSREHEKEAKVILFLLNNIERVIKDIESRRDGLFQLIKKGVQIEEFSYLQEKDSLGNRLLDLVSQQEGLITFLNQSSDLSKHKDKIEILKKINQELHLNINTFLK